MKSTVFFGFGILVGTVALAAPLPHLMAIKSRARPAAAQVHFLQAVKDGLNATREGQALGTVYVPEDVEANAWAQARGVAFVR